MREPHVVVIPDTQIGISARRIWSLLRPADVNGGTMIRVGRDYDGGYVMLDDALDQSIAYSFGISDDVSWDMDLAQRGCTIFQYDHTIDDLPIHHPKFKWHKTKISAKSSKDRESRTIEEILRDHNHKGRSDIILKMDIEGSEWDVIGAATSDTLEHFSQIVFEAHWLHEISDTNHYRRFVTCLTRLSQTHQIIHVHANNCGRVVYAGGVLLPETLEITCVRNKDHTFERCLKVFPTPLDMPCDHSSPDIFLGAIGLY